MTASAPTISPLTSILAPFIGENWTFQPTASPQPSSWREVISLFPFTANTATDVITCTAHPFANGDRVRVTSTDTIYTGLELNAYYYVRDASTNTLKLALTAGGAEIDLSGTPTGTFYLGASALPPGLALNYGTGKISGTPTKKGFFEISVIAANDYKARAFTGWPLAFTADAATDILTLTSGHGLLDGDVVRVYTTTTLPAGLAVSTDYYVRDLSSNTCKLAATLGGTAINITTAGTGTHSISSSYLKNVTGSLTVADGDIVQLTTAGTLPTGLSTATNYYVRDADSTNYRFRVSATLGGSAVLMTAAGIGEQRVGKVSDGDSAALVFPIGIRDARTILDAAIPIEWDFDTNLIRPLGGQASVDQEKPILHFKTGDQIILGVRFVKGGLPFSPSVVGITAVVRYEDEESKIAQSDGTVGAVGNGTDTRYYLLLEITAAETPSGGETPISAISNVAIDGPDVLDAWLELSMSYAYDYALTGTPVNYNRSSRSAPIKISRALLSVS